MRVMSSASKSRPVPRIQPGVFIIRGQPRMVLLYVLNRSLAASRNSSGDDAGDDDAIAWHRTTRYDASCRPGWTNGAPKFGALTCTSDRVPAGVYSGWPGSRSSTAIPDMCLFLEAVVSRRFVSSLEKVDFPADFGPHTSTLSFPCWASIMLSVRLTSFLFHSAGEESSWTGYRRGASSCVKSCSMLVHDMGGILCWEARTI